MPPEKDGTTADEYDLPGAQLQLTLPQRTEKIQCELLCKPLRQLDDFGRRLNVLTEQDGVDLRLR